MWSRLNFTKIFFFSVCLFLIVLPFFWIPVGSLDLGGDSSRIYFYDPIGYLKAYGLYVVLPEGIGNLEPHMYFFPYIFFLAGIKFILFNSSYLLNIAFDSIKLIVGFLAMYGIIKEFLFENKKNKKYNSTFKNIAVLGGLFYVLIPTMTGNWDKALLSHTQFFINPLLFYLLLKFFISKSYKYLLFALFVSFIFAFNFAFISAPPFFAFFPLAMVFLILYVVFIRKEKLPWKGILVGLIFFIGLQAFHLLPEIVSLFDKGSFTNTRVFDQASIIHDGVEYFYAVLSYASLSRNILLTYLHFPYGYVLVVMPLIIFLGLFFREKTNKSILLVGMFLLVLIYLLNAKITNIGIVFYAHLFYIPGFSIFRNFIGQWLFTFSFFYALMLSLAIAVIGIKLSRKNFIILLHFILVIMLFSAWPFFTGELVNKTVIESPKKNIAIKLDPNFIASLAYVKNIPTASKFLTLPFSDTWYQVVFGTNDGVYVGPSFLSYYAQKPDFGSYHAMQPFPELFLKLARDKNYNQIKHLLSILDIHYIFYDSKKEAYNHLVPDFVYSYVRQSLPSTQEKYKEFIKTLATETIFKKGDFTIFKIDSDSILPLIYTPKRIIPYSSSNTVDYPDIKFNTNTPDIRIGYLNESFCNRDLRGICKSDLSTPKVYFKRINPTRYMVTVSNITDPFVLIFSQAYQSSWKLFLDTPQSNNAQKTYFDGQIIEGFHENTFFNYLILQSLINPKPEIQSPHFLINGYANGWYISPKDIKNNRQVTFVLEMTKQRLFYYGIAISFITCISLIFWAIYLFFTSRKNGIIKR